MTLAEFALSAQAEGARVVCRGDIWWREVRRFFFRPLLPYDIRGPDTPAPGLRAVLGGFQHVVETGAPANSSMEFLVFREAQAYSLEMLSSDRRRQVRLAAKRFSVRPFSGLREFQEVAHPVYVSFFQRTRYSHFSERLDRRRFDRWAEVLFAFRGNMVLGAFAGAELTAVNVSRVIGDTLHFSTLFARREAMQQHVSSLLLHEVRIAAVESGDISFVFAGMRKTGGAESVDEFYLHRGCSIERKPACLRLNSIVKLAMQVFRPAVLRRLRGDLTP